MESEQVPTPTPRAALERVRAHAPRLIRGIGAPLALLAGVGIYVWVVDGHVPIGDWLFWSYALYWLLAIVWSVACLAAGHAATRAVLRVHLPLGEQIAIGFAVGVFLYFLAMFLAGLLGLYGPALFYVMPLAFLAAGGLPLWRTFRRYRVHLGAARRRARPASPWTYLVFAFGVVVLGMIYFLILSPANISYDSRWKHLAIAEHYIELGRVAAFPEGWYPGTAPHLASFLFAWAFEFPGRNLPDQLGLAAHMEYVAFLWTLVGIPALVRRVLPGASARLTWVVRFLFPGVMLYDSSLSTGADHLAAIFAIPIFLLLLRAWRRLDLAACALLAMMLAGGVLTKYSSAISLFAFPVAAVLLRAVWLAGRQVLRPGQERTRWFAGPLVAFVAGLAFTAPHWLKNWVWYGDPLYPVLHRYFTPTPWVGDSAQVFKYGYLAQTWSPTKDWAGLKEALAVIFNFSFVPNNWGAMHGKWPVIGSLLTLCFFCLPFVRANRRIWSLFGMIHVGIFSWYWVHHQDRHLQTLMPLMAAATAAVMILLWRTNKPTRAILASAIALQLIWAGDAYFFPTHISGSPIQASRELIASTFKRDPKQRIRTFGFASDVRAALPDDAMLLLHDIQPHAGMGAPAVSDHQGWQAGISYGHLHSPGAIWDRLKEMGVTHVLYPARHTRGWDSIAGDLAALEFFHEHLVNAQKVHGSVLAEMPATRPEGDGPGLVFMQTCDRTWKTGQYRFEDLRIPAFGPPRDAWPRPIAVAAEPEERVPLIASSDYLVVQKNCGELKVRERSGFRLLATRKRSETIRYGYAPHGEVWEIWRNARGAAPRKELPALPPALPAAPPARNAEAVHRVRPAAKVPDMRPSIATPRVLEGKPRVQEGGKSPLPAGR